MKQLRPLEERTVVLTIPETAWEDASDDAPPGSLLSATLAINGVGFFAEAFELTTDADGNQKVAHQVWEDDFLEARAGASSDGPVRTMTIQGRKYGVFIAPFCD